MAITNTPNKGKTLLPVIVRLNSSPSYAKSTLKNNNINLLAIAA